MEVQCCGTFDRPSSEKDLPMIMTKLMYLLNFKRENIIHLLIINSCYKIMYDKDQILDWIMDKIFVYTARYFS